MTERKLVLDNASNAKSFAENESEFLQHTAYQKVRDLLKKNLNDAKANDDSANRSGVDFHAERGHHSILINGQRGSGKTTFALTVLKKLQNEGAQKSDVQSEKIISLGILDPTLIDSKEHVLLAVITKIKQEVDEHFKSQPLQGRSSNGSSSSIFTNLAHPQDDWRRELEKLARGLQQLDGIGKDAMQDTIWEDPVTIMEEGLVAIGAGLDLNRQIHQFIATSLKVLNASAFALALDDIDTLFGKGWPVLEALRKYLTTPKLITLVCGDLQLYQDLVRKHQWLQFGALVTKFDTAEHSRSQYEDKVRQLTEQYLLKVLPGDRRVELNTVEELGDIKVEGAEEKGFSNEDLRTLDECLSEIINVNFQAQSGTPEADLFLGFIKKKPLRLLIQLLQGLSDKKIALPQLEGLFTNWVYAHGVSKLLQNNVSQPMLIQQLLEVLQVSGLMKSDLELLPKYSQVEQNTGAVVCNRILCDYFTHQPAKAIDYMVRGGLTRHALYYEGYLSQQKRPSAATIMAAMGATSGDDLITVTRQWSAVIVHGLGGGKQPNQLGTVQLLSEGKLTRNRPQGLKNLYRTRSRELVRAFAEVDAKTQKGLADPRSTFSLLTKGLAFLNGYYKERLTRETSQHFAITPLKLQSICKQYGFRQLADLTGCLFVTVSQGGQNFYRASSFHLIGLFAELLVLAQKRVSADELSVQVATLLARTGQIRTYPVPVDFSLQEAPSDQGSEEDQEDGEDDVAEGMGSLDDVINENQDLTLVDQLTKWLTDWKKCNLKKGGKSFAGLDYPPFVWSRIWQRFYYTLSQQDKGFNSNQRFLGEMIHRQLIAFLNSVMFEEQRYLSLNRSREENKAIALLSDNPTLSDSNYEINLARLLDSVVDAPLFNRVASCPLWHPLLSSQHHRQLEKLAKRHSKSSLAQSLFPLENGDDVKRQKLFKFDDDTGLYDLLNLIPPARVSDQATPTLWRHDFLVSDVLKNDKIQLALKGVLTDFEKSEKKDKSDKAFVLEHLARTSNAKIEAVIKTLRAEIKK